MRYGNQTVLGGIDNTTTGEGILIPRLTSVEEGSVVATDGELIFNTDLGVFRYYDGGAWVSLPVSLQGSYDNSVGGLVPEIVVDATRGAVTIRDNSVGTMLDIQDGGGGSISKLGTSGVRVLNGSASVPGYSFLGDTNTGIYSGGSDLLGISANGANCVLFDHVTGTEGAYINVRGNSPSVDPIITNVGSGTAGAGLGISILGRSSSLSGGAGGAVVMSAGDGNGSGLGGFIQLNAGNGGATGVGGTVSISGGSGGTTSGNGGPAVFSGGNAKVSGTGGAVSISGGVGGTTVGAGGVVTIQGGSSSDGNGGAVTILGRNATGTNRSGGDVTITSGEATGTAVGGNMTLTSGSGGGASNGGKMAILGGDAGSISGLGGSVFIGAGQSRGSATGGSCSINGGSGGSSGGVGGTMLVQGGFGGSSSGNGGDVRIVGGRPPGTSSVGDGGNVFILSGTYGDASGVFGDVTISGGDDANTGSVFIESQSVTITADKGSVRFDQYTAGTLQTDGAGNITAVSDENLKDVVGDFVSGLGEVISINPVLYRWKGSSGYESERVYVGFTAQNIYASVPGVVDTSREGRWSLSDRGIMAALVNGIKELNETVVELRERVRVLEG